MHSFCTLYRIQNALNDFTGFYDYVSLNKVVIGNIVHKEITKKLTIKPNIWICYGKKGPFKNRKVLTYHYAKNAEVARSEKSLIK